MLPLRPSIIHQSLNRYVEHTTNVRTYIQTMTFIYTISLRVYGSAEEERAFSASEILLLCRIHAVFVRLSRKTEK